jgi:hypothetical protein
VPYLISAKGAGFFWLYRALSSAHWKFAQLTGNPLRTADTTELVFARRFEVEGLAKQTRSCFGSKSIGIAIALRRVGPRCAPQT